MAMDAFAVCLAAGSLRLTQGPRPAFRLSFHFGLFQFITPVLGWLVGATIEPFSRNVDHWVAFGLLGFVGVRMIHSAMRGEESRSNDPSRGWTLVLLSIAVSVD
jgi:putative Mn2+ efflux pump MntP